MEISIENKNIIMRNIAKEFIGVDPKKAYILFMNYVSSKEK